jgi:hypothetical protein
VDLPERHAHSVKAMCPLVKAVLKKHYPVQI